MHCPRLRAFSSAGFPALSLVLVAKEPHSHELTHAASRSPQMEACCFIQRLLKFPDVGARCKCGDTLSLLLSLFLDYWKKRGSICWPNACFTWGWWILTFHSCNREKSLFVKATVNSLWMLLQFREKKYFPPSFIFPLHLCLKTGNWSRASKCNLARRLSLPPNDTGLFFYIEAVLHSLSLN